MKAIVRMLGLTVVVAIGLGSQSWAQGADELEEAGLAHFKRGYYEDLPKQRTAEAAAEFRMAEAALRRAIKQNPARASAHLHLGRTLFVQQKYREAAEVYGEALKIDPGNKPVYLQLASAREMAGDYPGAAAALEQLRSREDDPQAARMIDELISRMRARQ
jgi:cytochrome c-type biogenesis protein CcmH/NrfG